MRGGSGSTGVHVGGRVLNSGHERGPPRSSVFSFSVYNYIGSSKHEHTENSAINNVPLVYLHWGAHGGPLTR